MLFENLNLIDVHAPIKNELEKGVIIERDDGLLEIKTKTVVISSWDFVKLSTDRECHKWHEIFFTYYRHVHSSCYHCWKIVAAPKTLDELFIVQKIQNKQGLPCKCGAERRPSVPRLYGAYWYAPMDGGLEGARKLYKRVKKDLRKEIPKIQIFLKRGCTEFEHYMGPSDTWNFTDRNEALQNLLESRWYFNMKLKKQSQNSKISTANFWIHWAWENGDVTCMNYMSKPMFPDYVKYEDSIHSNKDFQGLEKKNDPSDIKTRAGAGVCNGECTDDAAEPGQIATI